MPLTPLQMKLIRNYIFKPSTANITRPAFSAIKGIINNVTDIADLSNIIRIATPQEDERHNSLKVSLTLSVLCLLLGLLTYNTFKQKIVLFYSRTEKTDAAAIVLGLVVFRLATHLLKTSVADYWDPPNEYMQRNVRAKQISDLAIQRLLYLASTNHPEQVQVQRP